MTRTLRYLLILLFVSVAGQAFAQSGAISGTVLDENGDALFGAVIKVTEGGLVKGGTQADDDGNYTVKPLPPGRYDVEITSPTFANNITKGVIVSPDKTTALDVKLKLAAKELSGVTVTAYKVPLIDRFNPGARNVIASEQIQKMPTRTTDGVAATAPGVYSGSDGLKIAGGRTQGTLYIVDGVQTRGRFGSNVSQNSIDQIEVMASGLSAKYGDAIGGVVSITTKGVTDKYRGNVLLEHSVDGYNHNLVNIGLSGPLYSKKLEDGTRKPIIGFRIGADGIYNEDPRPTYGGNYVVKEDVLNQLRANPLTASPNPNGVPVFRSSAEYITLNDLELQKKRVSADEYQGVINAKLDFALADNLTLTAGGSFNYNKSSPYSSDGNIAGYQRYTLFAPERIPTDIQTVARGYLKLTQRFGKAPGAGGADEKKPLISNAFYTLQADYQTEHFKREDPDHKDNLFKYGYVGKFYTDYQSNYQVGVDDSTGLVAVKFQTDREAVKTTFERSELNPVLANYTSQYFNSFGVQPRTVSDVLAGNALTNAVAPNDVYSLFGNIGTPNAIGGYRYYQYDQFAVNVDASFDFQPAKTKHAIQFGLYYQQRVERSYSTSALVSQGLWQYMNQLTNTHIGLDFANPIYISNGQTYTYQDYKDGKFALSPYDTVTYNRIALDSAQSTFDRNLRAKLGVGQTDYIDVNNYDPSTFSLDMFSADELLNAGNSFISYYGYDYTGKKQKGQVNFNDFFTKKDANGDYTRDIGAYRPNYIAGYILDQFQFKDINFNVGVRVDRFDNNTKVLKDPYSLYQVRTLGDSKGTAINQLNGGVNPSNMRDDYVVYVSSNESATPTIIGYRNGDDWYDPYGRFIEDPGVLKQYTGGRDPQPYLVDRNIKISDSTFDPNSSFTDYKPQVNVMPRVSFSFPISDKALFYAHYDVLVQRPRYAQFVTPDQYLYLANNNGQILNNSDLKPEKMFDYEVGFQQQISQSSALTLSGFYKERKDMIQIRPYLYAVPKTYYTYGNRDFSTTKGLTLKYDLRRVNHLLMNVSYTLQYAEGSGSGTNSGNNGNANFVSNSGLLANFIAASLPNLRYSTALDYDSRHNLVVNMDYRYSDNEGPMIGDRHILQNAGANFIFSARSGEPYTRYAFPAQRIITGRINDARYPWHYNIDFRVDKDFSLSFGNKKQAEGAKAKEPLVLNAYVMVMNVLNRRDVLKVNGYSGRPDEDGYITSPNGIQLTRNQSSPESYIDLYSVSNGIDATQYLPNNINLPRRVNIGLQLNF